MIIKKEVRTFIEYLHCLHCGTEMKLTGKVLMLNPPLYEYRCTECDLGETSKVQYPKTTYEEVEC